jgi:hypothetical protein
VCHPSPGFPAPDSLRVNTEALRLSLDRWNPAAKRYEKVGDLPGQALNRFEFGPMTHGPKIRNSDVKKFHAGDATVPPVFFGASLTNEFYGIGNIDSSAAPLGSGKLGNWSGDLSMLGFCIGPSTAYPIESDDGNEDLNGFLIAQGNPFVSDKGNNGSIEYNFGGVTFMNKEGCTDLYPVGDDPHARSGMVVNSVDCHPGTKMCFFSLWKFDGMPYQMANVPDCLVYCRLDDMANPTKCVESGIMHDEQGRMICRDYGLGGGVHGMMVGKTDTTDPSQVDLLLVFTKGMGYDRGTSWISKLTVKVGEEGSGDPPVKSLKQDYWGQSLWNDTITDHKKHDVGCDHATFDESGNIWVSTFRKENAGLHYVDYATGELHYSIHGFTDYIDKQYSYPAGTSGFGTLFQEGSMIALATSAEKFGIPEFGVGTLFMVDVSKMLDGVEPPPPLVYQCQPSTGSCNVCSGCCKDYITDGAQCDACVKQECL